ncbi:hypothetical protein ACFPLB_09085 [Aquamicrobium segne]|uniref:Uncharacterized protein n=1 Tax=Aquamicrobium segne TaxID=469547 RepID=A0ABW0GYF4_9HYPH
MLQSALLILLGFLSASFIGLLIAPPIWRRAERLTQRRLEASLPLTRSEITAEKDGLRAKFAMQARRLELLLAASQEREALQKVKIARLEQIIAELKSQTDSAGEALEAGKKRNDSLDERVRYLLSMVADDEDISLLKADSSRFAQQVMRIETVADEARLREDMAALAARVIHVTAEREGKASPIPELLAGEKSLQPGVLSLAERVLALQKHVPKPVS